jgi:hypothetical protein
MSVSGGPGAAAEDRVQATVERQQAALDRLAAASDRAVAAQDRVAAARNQAAALADREQAAIERAQRSPGRGLVADGANCPSSPSGTGVRCCSWRPAVEGDMTLLTVDIWAGSVPIDGPSPRPFTDAPLHTCCTKWVQALRLLLACLPWTAWSSRPRSGLPLLRGVGRVNPQNHGASPPIPSPISVTPITSSTAARITALLRRIQPLRRPSSSADRSPIAK